MILEKFQSNFGLDVLGSQEQRGELAILVKKDRLMEIFAFLKNDPDLSFDMLMDLCGADYLPQGEKPRFEAVYHFYSLAKNHRLRLRVKVPEEDMTLPSALPFWAAADWFERETFDMFGLRFEGHPNLRRLLMFDGFEGHPLQKDYPMERRQKIPVPEVKPT